MIYQKHILPELFDIGSVFYNIAGGSYKYHQYEDGQAKDKEPAIKYQKWEMIDDRFDSLFGSTYHVPLEKYPTYPDKIKIAIVGDHWLSNESTITDVRILDRWDMTYIHHCNYGNDLKYTLVDELKIMFPNATFDIVGDFSHSSQDMNTLQNVYDYLVDVEEYPDYLIFNGVEGTLINSGGDVALATTMMYSICGICAKNRIKAGMIYTLLPEVFDLDPTIGILQYLIVQLGFPVRGERFSGMPLDIEYFKLNEWLNTHLYIPEDYVKYGNNTDRLEQYKLPAIDNQGIHKEMVEWYIINYGARKYKEIIYNTIKNFIYENVFKDYNLKRNGFYISLSHKDVTENTYGYYHGDKAKVFQADHYPEQMITDIPIFGHSKYVFRSKYFTRNNPWNLFSNTGEYIAIALHTEYNHKCWIGEQKGSTCEDEESKKRQDTRGVVNELANLMYVLREREGAETRLRPPIMQGTGTSWLTISDNNKERYKNQLGYQCPIEVYISRDDYNFTITTRIHSEEGYQDIYQSVAAGKMTQSLDPLPLYVVGGTTGLKNDVYSYIPVAGVRTEIHGCVYDLDMDNVALSNTTANHPTKFYNCIFSNFKVYNSNAGEKWRSVFLHSQSATVQQNYNCAPPDDHAIWLLEPTYYLGRQDANAFPPSSDNRNRIGNKWLTKHGFEYCKGQEPMNIEPWWYDSPLQSFRAFTKTSWYDDKALYCSGNITSIFSSWDYRTPCGEITYPSAQVSQSEFDKDKTNWRLVSGVNPTDVADWQSETNYSLGSRVKIKLWEKMDSSIGVWEKDHDYVPYDVVIYNSIPYICKTYHTSSQTAFEEDADKWDKLQMWEPNTPYAATDIVATLGGQGIYKCLVTHVSSSVDFASDEIGVFEFTGKKYLVVPCGWEERLYWYDSHYVWTSAWATKLNNTWNNDSVLEEYEKNKLEFNRRQIKDKLFVSLEDNYYPTVKPRVTVVEEEPEPDPNQRIVLFFQFYTVHYFALNGFSDAVINSSFNSQLNRTFFVTEGWNTAVNRMITHSDVTYTDWRKDIYDGIVTYCERAEDFTSKFYITDLVSGKLRQPKHGDTLDLGDTTFFAGNFNSMWDNIKEWITDESLGDSSNMNASTAIIHQNFTRTNRPANLFKFMDAFGVKFKTNTSLVPIGFPIDDKYDTDDYLRLTCNFFYRWLMPCVLYTEVAGRYKLSKIMQDLDDMFLPYTTNKDGFNLIYKAAYFRKPE